jgi:hypothetical protein
MQQMHCIQCYQEALLILRGLGILTLNITRNTNCFRVVIGYRIIGQRNGISPAHSHKTSSGIMCVPSNFKQKNIISINIVLK